MEAKNASNISLHPYTPHLLEDIAAAYRREKRAVVKPPPFAEIIEDFIRMRDEPGQTLGYFSGLNAETFPPPEQLTKKEIKLVASAFKKRMLTWNLKCRLPKNIPAGMESDQTSRWLS